MRGRLLLASLVSLGSLALGTANAQSVKGVVVDDSTKLAVEGVLIALIDGDGRDVPRTVRSDSAGAFIVHAQRPGSYRVRATRIGYRPVTSDPVSLNIGQLAVVRLRMTTIAQQLVPVRVVERRQMSAAELMSTTGFDLRESKGLGAFIGRERLAAMGQDGVRDILATQLQPTLYIRDDPVLGEVIRLRQGRAECAPEIYLDAQLLATAPDPVVVIDTTAAVTPMDTVRLRMSAQGEEIRAAAGQIYALSVLSNLRASDLHGIEVYRANQVPPASLGAWFGSTKRAIRPCGTVAVWTKNGGGRPVITAVSERVDGLQVISGTTINSDTGEPMGGVTVTLLNDAREPLGAPVRSDQHGEFRIRTNRAGKLRLRTEPVGYTSATSPSFEISRDELVFVQLLVSPTQALLAPLGVRARVLPTTFPIAAIGGFTYRRERALGGTFFDAAAIAASGAGTLVELVRSVPGILADDQAVRDTIVVVPDDDLPRCRPVYYMDGAPVSGDAETAVRALVMTQVFGVEVYTRARDVPPIFADATENCGLIAIWMKPSRH